MSHVNRAEGFLQKIKREKKTSAEKWSSAKTIFQVRFSRITNPKCSCEQMAKRSKPAPHHKGAVIKHTSACTSTIVLLFPQQKLASHNKRRNGRRQDLGPEIDVLSVFSQNEGVSLERVHEQEGSNSLNVGWVGVYTFMCV